MLNPSLKVKWVLFRSDEEETRRQRSLWEGTVRKHALQHLTETIDQNRLINVCVLHIFISVSNINGRKRICFPNEHEAIKYFRHTSLKTQSWERTCIFKAPQWIPPERCSLDQLCRKKCECCERSTSSWRRIRTFRPLSPVLHKARSSWCLPMKGLCGFKNY